MRFVIFALILTIAEASTAAPEFPRPMRAEEVHQLSPWFPKLHNASILAPRTAAYNCYGYALDPARPTPLPTPDLDHTERLYTDRGFREVESPQGPGTVALYYLGGRAVHAAVLTQRGWESKLGRGILIRHSLRDIEGPMYGTVGKYLVAKERRDDRD